jgi:stress response protein YsnF
MAAWAGLPRTPADPAPPQPWHETTVIPVVEEVVAVERRPVLKEEVRLGRVQVTQRHRETVLLRTRQASVHGLPVETTEADPSAAAPAVMQPSTRNQDE